MLCKAAAPDTINNDKGASFVAVYKAITTFITALDGRDGEESPAILGDGDIARIYAQYLSRRGKSEGIGTILFRIAADKVYKEAQAEEAIA